MERKHIHILAYSLFGIFILANIIFFVGTEHCFACEEKLVNESKMENLNLNKQIIETISLNAWKEKMSQDNIQIIDVRTAEEFNSGSIEGAINIDYYKSDFKTQISQLNKNKTYLIYCRSGHRGGLALPIFEELGFNEVYNLDGGYNVWN